MIDEAHIIESKETFEEIRLLLNYQHEGKTLMSLFLVGQPELGLKVDMNKPLAQRLAMRAHLSPLMELVPMTKVAPSFNTIGILAMGMPGLARRLLMPMVIMVTTKSCLQS